MLYRAITALVVGILSVSIMPFSKTTVVETGAQNPALQLSQTKVNLPDGGRTLTLSGVYQAGPHQVKLHGLTIAKNLPSVSTTDSQPASPDAPEENEFRPQEDYYYSYSDMSRSDGTPLVQARYEYQEPTDRSILYITAAGVTVTVDFNNVDFDSLSDADAERLDTWVGSDEGRLVQETCVAIINEGSQQTDSELLLNYYVISMMVDNNPPLESASIPDKKLKNQAHHAVMRPGPERWAVKSARFGDACALPTAQFLPQYRLSYGFLTRPTLGVPPESCFGYCGWGCAGIPDRCGRVIEGGPCEEHDRCTRENGNRPNAPPCRRSFRRAAIYVYISFTTCTRIWW